MHQALLVSIACWVPVTVASAAEAIQTDEQVLRVCADPNNMPLSNEGGEGYENKIAAALARDLGKRLEFTFFPQRMGFVRNTLRQRDAATQQFKCDVIIGVPKGFELTATTRPYMRSTYALVFAARDDLPALTKADDLLQLAPEKRRTLRVGVFGRSPGADWLLRNDMLDHAVFYTPQSGDPAESPAHVIEQDLAAGKIDMAILWGPMAGFLVREHAAFPTWRAVPFTADPEIKFDFEIAMGVRFGENEWKETLNRWIETHESTVRDILASYRVPLLDASGGLVAPAPEAPSDKVRAGAVPKEIPLRLDATSSLADGDRS